MSDEIGFNSGFLTDMKDGIYGKVKAMQNYLNNIESLKNYPYNFIKQQFEGLMHHAESLLDNPFPTHETRKEVFYKIKLIKGVTSIEGEPAPVVKPEVHAAIVKMESFLEDVGLIEYYSEKDSIDRLDALKTNIESILSGILEKSTDRNHDDIYIDSLTNLHETLDNVEYELKIVVRSAENRYASTKDDADRKLCREAKELLISISPHSHVIHSVLLKKNPLDWDDFLKDPRKYGC